ncbi:MAG: PilZ domain-containing protein [Phreatobacter sp.]|uniref:PilZ domain-containing protein n=1 Tax=Phreatobacter sp. TaxID=1966341 RepID=UPI001A5DE3FE|nr:PilZ domain-containing protein [Phreatobacter sp.]
MPRNPEHRTRPRREVAYRVTIEGESAASISCRLIDISETGVRIEVNEGVAVSQRFVLRLSSMANHGRYCETVWRTKEELGARFLETTSETGRTP